MSIKSGEIGKIFRYATGYDLSANTSLTLNFTAPTGGTSFSTTSVTAPASPVDDPDLGALAASTYMVYTTTGTDFDVPGTWTVCGVYEDGTPKKFYGDDATFTVGEACD